MCDFNCDIPLRVNKSLPSTGWDHLFESRFFIHLFGSGANDKFFLDKIHSSTHVILDITQTAGTKRTLMLEYLNFRPPSGLRAVMSKNHKKTLDHLKTQN